MKDLHIVFGAVPLAIIQQSGLYKAEKVDIMALWDILNIGPIYDIDDATSVENRMQWICDNYGSATFNTIDNIVLEDIRTIKLIMNNAKNYQDIYLWSGVEASEIVHTARLVYLLADSNTPLYKMDFPNIPIVTKQGKTIYPNCLSVTDTAQTAELPKHFKKLGQSAVQEYIQLWERIRTSDSFLRFMHADGSISLENDLDHLDSFIFRHCTGQFRSAATIVAYTLTDTGFNVGDSILFKRLQKLVKLNKLEAKGDLNYMGKLELREVQSQHSD